MNAEIKTLVRVLFIAFRRAGLKVNFQHGKFHFFDAEPDDSRILDAVYEAGFPIIMKDRAEMISTVATLRKAGVPVVARENGNIWALHVNENDWDYYYNCVLGDDAVDISF